MQKGSQRKTSMERHKVGTPPTLQIFTFSTGRALVYFDVIRRSLETAAVAQTLVSAGSRLVSILRACLIACLAVSGLAAAEHRGQVLFSGLPVPGVTITATQADKRLVAVTDQQGTYNFKDLPDGTWKFQVEMLCFATIHRDVVVAPGAPAAIWEMKLLPFAEIQAAAGPQPPKPATAPQQQTAQTAPPAAPPETLAPTRRGKSKAAAQAPPPNPQTGFQRADLTASADGGKLTADAPDPNQSAADGLLVSGSVNNGAASPFAQSPAFGNNRKGGRSLYNGSVGITLDNAFLDARSFSLTGQDTPKPAYNHMTGFASFGGPLYIPHLMKPSRNPLYVFAGYQFVRNRNASIQSALMPDAAERLGDFSLTRNPLGLPVSFIDPANKAPFPGNVIPPSRLSAQAQSLLNLYPLPNFQGSTRYNYQVPLVGIGNSDGMQTNLNKTFSAKDQVFGNFGYQRTSGANPNLFNFVDTNGTAGLTASANLSHRFTNRFFARFGFTFSRYSSRTTPYFANRQNISGAAGIMGNNRDPLNWGPPNLTFSGGIAGLSDAVQALDRNQTSAFSYSSFWNHRNHNVQFGADLKRLEFNNLSQQNPRGRFGFTGAATQAGEIGTGSDFADFLLGIPDTSAIAFGNADKYFRSSSYDAFFTDDWRINSALTVNAGGRWEYSAPVTEKYGRLVNLDIAPGYTAVTPVVASDPVGALTGEHYPDSLVHPDKHAVQPRIGIAWRPLPASSLIFRAGYGVYYNTSVYQTIASQMAQQSPLSTSLSVQNSPNNPLTLANGFIASKSITPNTFAIDPDFRIGYAQNWNVVIQRDLPGSLIMNATYLGIKGTREQQEFLPNTYPIGAANPCPSCPAGYAYLTSNGNSTREAAQIQLRRRLHSGFTASLMYTFSKAIDDASLGGRGQGTSVIAQNWLDLSGERGLSTFDQRHLLSATAQYTTGMGAAGGTLRSGWRGAAYKEWTFTTQINAGSGLPESPIYVASVQGTGVLGTLRPEYTGAGLYSAPSGFFLNPAAYIAPLPGQWGNAARDSILGPAQFSLNASVSRTFRLNDRFNADLKFNANNLFNHVNYSSWNSYVNSAQFGLPTSANGMRTVQASLRVRF